MDDPADTQAEIYASDPAGYDRLVDAEDVDANLAPAILGGLDPDGLRVVEAGAGTGRITRLLTARGARVVATDLSEPMLRRASARGADALAVADATALPHPPGVADLAVAGWVLAHFRLWLPAGWRERTRAAIGELHATLRPGGRLVVVESLGTCVDRPGAPSPELAEFHGFLEDDLHLSRAVIATDYVFTSPEEAATVTERFFGVELADRVRTAGSARVPEFTGVWAAQAAGPANR